MQKVQLRDLGLCVGLAVAFAACKSGPKVSLCAIDALTLELVCVDYNGKQENIPIEAAQASHTCLSNRDMETVIRYCKR